MCPPSPAPGRGHNMVAERITSGSCSTTMMVLPSFRAVPSRIPQARPVSRCVGRSTAHPDVAGTHLI